MHIEVFTLCDAAADYQGRLSILGIFDTILATQMPAVHPFCSVALRIRFERIEQGEQKLRLHIVDDDGNPVIPEINGTFTVNVPKNLPIATTNLVLNLGQLKFTKHGEYEINLAMNGSMVASLPLFVKDPSEERE